MHFTMSLKTIGFYVLVVICPFTASKGLYSGVPCHRPYKCIFEEYEGTEMIDQREDIVAEELCQSLCRDNVDCKSYSWFSEDDPTNPNLCQLFSQCLRDYQNLLFSTVYSGPRECKDPIVVFGGDGEDIIDPQEVEVIWPGSGDVGFPNKFGYATIGNFDPLPIIPEEFVGSFWNSGVILLNDTLIMTCGGGYTGTDRCFGLDLVSGSWKTLASMIHPRSESPLLKVGNAVVAVGGGGTLAPTMEIYNSTLDQWTPKPEWNSPYSSFGHCSVAYGNKIMVIGGYGSLIIGKAMIFDFLTERWSWIYLPNPRYDHGCLHTFINGTEGVLVTGGNNFEDDNVKTSADFYQIETGSWISLPDFRDPVSHHQMVEFEGQPAIIGGEDAGEDACIGEDGHFHKRSTVQMYDQVSNMWNIVPLLEMNFKRSRFSAINTKLWQK